MITLTPLKLGIFTPPSVGMPPWTIHITQLRSYSLHLNTFPRTHMVGTGIGGSYRGKLGGLIRSGSCEYFVFGCCFFVGLFLVGFGYPLAVFWIPSTSFCFCWLRWVGSESHASPPYNIVRHCALGRLHHYHGGGITPTFLRSDGVWQVFPPMWRWGGWGGQLVVLCCLGGIL